VLGEFGFSLSDQIDYSGGDQLNGQINVLAHRTRP
jgi:hypothetical protein